MALAAIAAALVAVLVVVLRLVLVILSLEWLGYVAHLVVSAWCELLLVEAFGVEGIGTQG